MKTFDPPVLGVLCGGELCKYAAIAAFAMLLCACAKAEAPAPATAAPVPQPEPTKAQQIELGLRHKSAFELYQALREQAKGGQRIAWNTLPDWSGVYTRTPAPGFAFDPDQPADGLPTAKLTPAFQARMMKRIDDAKRGIEWDPGRASTGPNTDWRWLEQWLPHATWYLYAVTTGG